MFERESKREQHAEPEAPRQRPRQIIQAKLTVGAANDPLELEADRVADSVMRALGRTGAPEVGDPGGSISDELSTRIQPTPDVVRAKRHDVAADRRAPASEPVVADIMRDLASAFTLDDHHRIARSIGPEAVGPAGGPLDTGTEARIQRSRGSGSRLPEPLRGSMENAFGADFDRVRVHTGPASDELNRSMQARAFTVGSDIHFARGQYQPGSERGQALLAHELTHTIQQGAAGQSLRVHRALVDVESLADRLRTSGLGVVSKHGWDQTYASLREYQEFLKTTIPASKKLGNYRDPAAGAPFYERMQAILGKVSAGLNIIVKHRKAKSLDKAWLIDFLEEDIPQTLGWAATVRDTIGRYGGKTVLLALQTARKSALSDYLANEYENPDAWASKSAQEKDIILTNRDADAATVAGIRKTAQEMLKRKESPKNVLAYMSREAKNFLESVVRECINALALPADQFVVVTTGSFGADQLFPYSDADIQLMKANLQGGDELLRVESILKNIQMRVRLANMKEGGGKWTVTQGWDVDNLGRGGYNAQTAIANEPYMGLAFSNVMVATGGGESEAQAMQQHYRKNRVEGAIKLMTADPADLYNKVQHGTFAMLNSAELDNGAEPFEFNEKFMRLPKIFLNALAMYHNLDSHNSWDRVDELLQRQLISKKVGSQFKTYLDITSAMRLRYQFFYEHEARDDVTPSASKQPTTAGMKAYYPKGYYVLTGEDRKLLKKAQAIQVGVLVPEIIKTRDELVALRDTPWPAYQPIPLPALEDASATE